MLYIYHYADKWGVSMGSSGRALERRTLKAGGPFYLVSIPGEVKDPTRGGGGGVNV